MAVGTRPCRTSFTAAVGLTATECTSALLKARIDMKVLAGHSSWLWK
jgi:hypothetical protein